MSRPVVAITRPKDRAKKTCELVEEMGGEAFLAPTLYLEPTNTESLKELVKRKDELDWIIFTSPTTIVSIDKFYPNFLKNLECKIAVIGNKTGKLAKKYGLTYDLIPEEYTAEGLVREFKKQNITGKTIGLPRTASARVTLPKGLEKLGNEVILAEAYKSLFPMEKTAIRELMHKIKTKEIDAITFTSPLTVRNFFELAEDRNELTRLVNENLLTVCIGPITGKLLSIYNVDYIHPNNYTVPDMMELLFKTWRKENE